jgi:peptidyl-prolyl cis-trans isomerase SurA
VGVAKTSLDSVYTLIKSGSLTIPDAVTKYSESPTKKSGGFMVNPYSGGLSFDENSLDESMSSSVLNMNIGDYSMPILSKTEEGEPCYKIVVLKKKTLAHKANLIEDYDKIQKAALEDKKQRILDKWVTDKIKDIYVNILTEYKKCSFTHPWIKD